MLKNMVMFEALTILIDARFLLTLPHIMMQKFTWLWIDLKVALAWTLTIYESGDHKSRVQNKPIVGRIVQDNRDSWCE